MSFLDRIRAWFRGETRRRPAPGPATADPSPAALRDLEEFLETRDGVEGYLEPRTAVYTTTLLLVAGDGEYLRRPVRDRAQAEELCRRHGVPLYDAAIVGYPRRMRDYGRGVRRDERVPLEELPPWPGDEEPPPDIPEAEAD